VFCKWAELWRFYSSDCRFLVFTKIEDNCFGGIAWFNLLRQTTGGFNIFVTSLLVVSHSDLVNGLFFTLGTFGSIWEFVPIEKRRFLHFLPASRRCTLSGKHISPNYLHITKKSCINYTQQTSLLPMLPFNKRNSSSSFIFYREKQSHLAEFSNEYRTPPVKRSLNWF